MHVVLKTLRLHRVFHAETGTLCDLYNYCNQTSLMINVKTSHAETGTLSTLKRVRLSLLTYM